MTAITMQNKVNTLIPDRVYILDKTITGDTEVKALYLGLEPSFSFKGRATLESQHVFLTAGRAQSDQTKRYTKNTRVPIGAQMDVRDGIVSLRKPAMTSGTLHWEDIQPGLYIGEVEKLIEVGVAA